MLCLSKGTEGSPCSRAAKTLQREVVSSRHHQEACHTKELPPTDMPLRFARHVCVAQSACGALTARSPNRMSLPQPAQVVVQWCTLLPITVKHHQVILGTRDGNVQVLQLLTQQTAADTTDRQQQSSHMPGVQVGLYRRDVTTANVSVFLEAVGSRNSCAACKTGDVQHTSLVCSAWTWRGMLELPATALSAYLPRTYIHIKPALHTACCSHVRMHQEQS